MSEHAAEHEPSRASVERPPVEAAPAAPDLAPAAASVMRLQRTAGNAAVNQLLAREPYPPGGPVPSTLSMRGGDTPFQVYKPNLDLVPKVQSLPSPDVSAAIRTYLQAQRANIAAKSKGGGYSMDDLVADIRKAVASAATTLDFQMANLIDLELGLDAPKRAAPPVPVKIPGLQEKLAALFAGGSGESGKVLVERNGSYLKVVMIGLEAKYSANKPGTETTAVKVGPSGVELKTEDKGNTTTITAGWGDSFGFKTKTSNGTVFEATISKEEEKWAKWSVSVSIPIVGKEVVEARPPVNEIVESVNKGYGAAVGALGHVAGGGKPTDEVVKQKFKDVKPAIEKLAKAVEERKGPNVTFKFGAEGAPMTTPGGQSVQNTFVGASLVVEF